MKKIFLLSMLITASAISFAQVTLQSLVKPGTRLIYAVMANGEKYDFIVTVKALTPALVFDWQMTNAANSSGTITHTPQAMLSANTMYNYFAPGAKTLSDDMISVWLSKNTFTGLTKGSRSVLLRMNTGETPKKMGMTEADAKEVKILVNGEKETVEEQMAIVLNDAGTPKNDDETFFSFNNSAKMPVIIRMNNGFYLALKEIKTK
ncbi:MAG: hypothetical protein IPO42_15945 [Chitinophagaceae bacterium]|nr:hypothetical protein [Chitinophagaceae bacterium]